MRAMAFLGLLLLAAAAEASNYSDFLPTSKGQGLDFIANTQGPFSIFLNPAATANAPYSELGTTMGRLLSPRGTLSFLALGYIRPYEPIKSATLGAAYYAERQKNSTDKDVIAVHYSQEFALPELHLDKPVKVGGNFKALNVEQGVGAGFGGGFDGGVLVRSNYGLNAAFTLMDLTTNVGIPRPQMALGLTYLWHNWLTVAGDMRFRSNLTEFYPGLEGSFYQGLLKVRIGRGLKLDGPGNVALGVGINFSPVIIDFSAGIPWDGINRDGGSYHAAVVYRFGAPSFTGTFVGIAATQAEGLKSQILELEDKKNSLQTEATAAESNHESAQGELRAADQRLRELQTDYDQLLKKKEETAYELSNYELGLRNIKGPPPPPPPKPAPPKAAKEIWPRRHTVSAGDTLRTIAKAYYGDPNLWEQIYEANGDKIERGLPQEGAVLIIPEPKR